MSRLAILGAGSWGTVLAALFAGNGHQVALWCRSAHLAASIQATRRHERAAPGLQMPEPVWATADLAGALDAACVVLFALPTDAMREVARAAAPALPAGAGVVSCAKGFERGSRKRMTEVLAEEVPAVRERIAALSGPNLAGEIAEGRPAAAVIAAPSRVGTELQELLSSPRLRLYTNADVVGVEYGGALKNCIAIAAGVADGLEVGVNSRSAVITRGLAEIARLGVAAGAQPLTFAGLAGLGDLIATSSSPRSRNYQVGLHLAAGKHWPEIAALLGHVAEGVNTTTVARELAAQYRVRTPIIDNTYQVLFAGRAVDDALEELLSGAPRDELTELMQGAT